MWLYIDGTVNCFWIVVCLMCPNALIPNHCVHFYWALGALLSNVSLFLLTCHCWQVGKFTVSPFLCLSALLHYTATALKSRFWPLTQTCNGPIKSWKVIFWVCSSLFQSKFAQLAPHSGTKSSLQPSKTLPFFF